MKPASHSPLPATLALLGALTLACSVGKEVGYSLLLASGSATASELPIEMGPARCRSPHRCR